MSEHYSIVGAGLAGSLMAATLARRGVEVDVYERRADLRTTDEAAGRSINLALSTRGRTALSGIELDLPVLENAIPMVGRLIHARDGAMNLQPYGLPGQAIYSVSRRELNERLLTAAEQAGARLHFGHKCVAVDVDAGVVTLGVRAGGSAGDRRTVDSAPGLIIGADGAYSPVRNQLRRSGRFNDAQEYLEHGYKELTIPATEDGDFRMDRNALHIWPRHDFMLIALPNRDGTFTCTLFLSFDRFEELDTVDAARAFFAEEFADVLPMMSNFDEEFANNPVGSLVTIRCSPYQRARALLIGDAAHAIVPFYGQGMNAAFEDCTLLNALLDEHADPLDAFAAFSATRKADADAIADLANYNFLEMRDRVASDKFVARKTLERRLHRLVEDRFIPLYGMVTFTNIPYAEAQRRASAQAGWVDDVILKLGATPSDADLVAEFVAYEASAAPE